MTDTQILIRRLSTELKAVRRLPAPEWRTLIWFAIALPYVASFVVIPFSPRPDLGAKLMEWRFFAEQTAALATALLAAWAAFSMTVPGFDQRRALLVLLPLATWIGLLAEGCGQAIGQGGWTAGFTADWICFPMIALIGLWPAIVMVVMLRRGAPLRPHATVAMGGLAAAGLSNVALRLFHGPDVSLTILVWQVGSALVLAWLAGLLGPALLEWQTRPVRDPVSDPEGKNP
jgi:hypothetical protein